jgi:hypothetical protein
MTGDNRKPQPDPKPDRMAELAVMTPMIRADLLRMGVNRISHIAIKHRVPRAHVAQIAEAME